MWGSMKQLSRAILIRGFYNRPENKIAINRICRIKYLLKTRAVFIIVKSNSKSQADSVTLIFSKVDQLLYTEPVLLIALSGRSTKKVQLKTTAPKEVCRKI